MIKIHKIKQLPYETTFEELCANIIEDGRRFFGVSHDSQYSCNGIIIDYENNFDNSNPPLRILNIFKNENKNYPLFEEKNHD